MNEIASGLTAEQAAHIAQLQLRNHILFIGTLIWAIMLAAWIIFCTIKFCKTIRSSLINSNTSIHFQCKKCNTDILVPVKFLIKHPFIPKKRLNVSGPVLGYTKSIEKRLYCPSCKRKNWCRQNVSETYNPTLPKLIDVAKVQFPLFFTVGAIIFIGGIIFFSIVKLIFS